MKFIFTFLITSLFIYSSFGQEPIDDSKEDDDDVEIINFGNDENDRENVKYKDMIIKTSPTSFIFGKQPFELEKEITDYFSIQGGLGLTFSPVNAELSAILSEIDEFENSYCESTQWQNDACDSPFEFDYRTITPGFLASISGRLYWDQDGFDGGYLSPVLRYSTRGYKVQKIDETRSSSTGRLSDSFDNETEKNLDFVVHYGAQYLGETLTWEYFIGLGVRSQTRTLQDLGYDNNGDLRNGELQEIKRNRMLIALGIRVGFRL